MTPAIVLPLYIETGKYRSYCQPYLHITVTESVVPVCEVSEDAGQRTDAAPRCLPGQIL